jgi:hypothetical protein
LVRISTKRSASSALLVERFLASVEGRKFVGGDVFSSRLKLLCLISHWSLELAISISAKSFTPLESIPCIGWLALAGSSFKLVHACRRVLHDAIASGGATLDVGGREVHLPDCLPQAPQEGVSPD